MKDLMYLNKKQLQRHILIWIIAISYSNIYDPLPGTWAAKIIGSALIHFNYVFVFYSISLFVFPKFWESNRFFVVLGTLLVLIVYWFNSRITSTKVIPTLGGATYYLESSLFYFLKKTFYYFIIVGAAASASFFYRYGLYKLKIQAEKEKTLLIKELNFLKTPFNSQITFDFLNYCHNKIRPYSPETAKSIDLFSDMLRYTLYTKPEEIVPLQMEIMYIEKFITLQKLLSVKVYVNYTYSGQFDDKLILPRILITFVENAFKHGQFNEPEYPINIDLNVNDNKLTFSVRNKINPTKKMVSSHTGLENVTQILDLYYPNQYQLKKEETEGFYQVELSMTLT